MTIVLIVVWFTLNVIYNGVIYCLPSAILAIKIKTNDRSQQSEDTFKDIAISITPEFVSYVVGKKNYF